ncbi:trans-sialidase, partial [Trypanosoma cruzi]
VRLTEQLQRVKEVPATWKKVDEHVSQPCPTSGAAKSALTDNACSAVKIADGLAGILSGSFSNDTWRDEYLGVNATVMKGTKGVATGYAEGATFQGARAEWPVGEQGENQPYHFANHKFTLVATVSTDKAPKEEDNSTPFLGVRLGTEGGSKLMELSYNSEKKWKLFCATETNREHSSTWEPEAAHQVAIVLQNGNQGSVYVDGQRVGGE